MELMPLMTPEEVAEQGASFRAEISRANGSKSRGPITEKGKKTSSRNSVKHGAYSKTLKVPEELKEEYEEFKNELLEMILPRNLYEEKVAARIVTATWLIDQLRDVEEDFLQARILETLDSGLAPDPEAFRSPFARPLADQQRNLTRANKDLEHYRKGKIELPKEPESNPEPAPAPALANQATAKTSKPKTASPDEDSEYFRESPEVYEARRQHRYAGQNQQPRMGGITLEDCNRINSRGYNH